MLTRENSEEREDRELAGYAMKSGASRGRRHSEPEHAYRTVFQRDRDRIIHSTAFRRLEYKTQVFVNHEGDHYRTRLTHTIEVSQIARSIARALRLNEDLVETLALAHDLGHGPFGHSGEEALSELMADHGGFEHNAQSLRVVDVLERRYPDFAGLNLTWEVRESIVKHETEYDKPSAAEFEPELQPLIEAQVVNAADPIAYDNHDIDDGLRAGSITEGDLDQFELWRKAIEAVRAVHPGASGEMKRMQAIRWLIDAEVTDLVRTTLARVEERGIRTLEDVRQRGAGASGFSERLDGMRRELQSFLMDRVYKHYRVARMEAKAKRFVHQLFNEFIAYPRQLPSKFQAWAREVGTERAVCDYIAGMTDRYAQQEYQRLFHPFEIV
ncbi:MAG: deoxyguanosinetriphosphate triphosphohydrolase [Planctomycetes bacterium]|nr:deoxyguanosinetriphosphate triphosphohydrolase [Planctomycetota bacterium]